MTEQQLTQVGQGIYHITEGVGAPECVIMPWRDDENDVDINQKKKGFPDGK